METRPNIVQQMIDSADNGGKTLKIEQIRFMALLLHKIQSDIKTLIDSWDGSEAFNYALVETPAVPVLRLQTTMKKQLQELIHLDESTTARIAIGKIMAVAFSQREFMQTIERMTAPSPATKRFIEDVVAITIA